MSYQRATSHVVGGLTPAQTVTLSEAKGAAYSWFATDFLNPVNADWAINALASAEADPDDAALTLRAFDDTTEEGVGFLLKVPSNAAGVVTLSVHSRALTGVAKTVRLNWRSREIPDDAAATPAWSSAVQLTDIAISADDNYDTQTQTQTLAALGLTAGLTYLIELTRDATDAGDDLVGDWGLFEIGVDFS